jgi:ketosteroid isomerase-like protein
MDDEQAVLEANSAFYEAFEGLDMVAMARVWANGASDVCIHPGWDILRGPKQVHQAWRMIFENTTYLRFEVSRVRVEVTEEVSIVSCIENIFSVVGGHTVHSRVACTNVFRRSDGPEGDWEMVVHHASPIAQGQTVVPIEDGGDLN